MQIKKNYNYILNWLFIFIIIVVSDDTLLFGTNLNYKFISIKYLIILVMTSILSFKYILLRKEFAKNEFIYCIGMIILIFISSALNGDLRLGVFYKIALLLAAFSITRKMTLYQFSYYFDSVIYILAIWSLIGFIFGIIGRGILNVLPVFENTAGTTFYNGLLFFIPTSKELLRNYGIFREPGIYQMFLIIALVLQIGVLKESRIKKIIIYIIAILATLSTTGFFALAIIFILFFMKKQGVGKRSYNIVIITCIFALILIYLIYPDIFSHVFQMVFGKLSNTKRYTTIARMGSIIINFKIFVDNIILGVGLTQLSYLFPRYCLYIYGRAFTHNTNTLLIQFATHGVFYGIMWSYGYYSLCRKLGSNFFEVFLYISIFVILFIGENITFSLVTYIFIFYGIKKERATFNIIK
ncbi:hypothetical protein [Clostridium perfringens]|uniref:hypothetical protein n=1 Tax=Clostridium perfringens TaxID=1502 RepID=UPI0022E28535|nr:hypothetical protein [Clostridium perfringens]